MKFGIHNPSWFYGPDPAEAFEAVKAKAQWAENHGFVWFSVMDHMIQIGGVGAPDEPFILNPAVDLETVTGFAAPYNQGERLKRVRGAAAGRVGGPSDSV